VRVFTMLLNPWYYTMVTNNKDKPLATTRSSSVWYSSYVLRSKLMAINFCANSSEKTCCYQRKKLRWFLLRPNSAILVLCSNGSPASDQLNTWLPTTIHSRILFVKV